MTILPRSSKKRILSALVLTPTLQTTLQSRTMFSPSSSCPVWSIAPPKDGFVCEKFTIEDKDQNKLYTYYFYRLNNHKNHPFPTEYNSLDKEEFNQVRKAYERFKKRDAKQAAGYTTKKRGREVREGNNEGQGRLKRSKQDEEEDERVNLLERALIDESMEVATSQTEVRLLKNQLADVRQLLETKKQAATKVRKAQEILSKDLSLTTSFSSDLFLLFFRRASFTAISSIKNEVGFDVDPKTVYKSPKNHFYFHCFLFVQCFFSYQKMKMRLILKEFQK